MDMKKTFLALIMQLGCSLLYAQDSTEVFDFSQYGDASQSKSFCTQKVLNQSPSKQISIGYEFNPGFQNNHDLGVERINSMGGLRTSINLLAISTNKLILSLGANYWGSRIRTDDISKSGTMNQVYNNRMDVEGINLLMFKPLNNRHFIIAQLNVDASYVGTNNEWQLTKESITYYGSAIFGWKKNDYRMLGLGVSRTYRMGRPLIVPVLLYNKTFNEQWGIEALLPARAHVRYNFNPDRLLMAGYELEGQQYDLAGSNRFLQRGEIKPRLVFEQKLVGFVWLSAQFGYRINGRFNLVDRYNGQEEDEVFKNKWGASPYFNLSINLVTP
jgi:hypothetical protein